MADAELREGQNETRSRANWRAAVLTVMALLALLIVYLYFWQT